mmetsp:Transcript_50737/g.121221  ORF Transcript_50737/g.121221 Transcript_50737/m.121221 type:complete len:227 (+) Transcript_50737:948-1628(+)
MWQLTHALHICAHLPEAGHNVLVRHVWPEAHLRQRRPSIRVDKELRLREVDLSQQAKDIHHLDLVRIRDLLALPLKVLPNLLDLLEVGGLAQAGPGGIHLLQAAMIPLWGGDAFKKLHHLGTQLETGQMCHNHERHPSARIELLFVRNLRQNQLDILRPACLRISHVHHLDVAQQLLAAWLQEDHFARKLMSEDLCNFSDDPNSGQKIQTIIHCNHVLILWASCFE